MHGNRGRIVVVGDEQRILDYGQPEKRPGRLSLIPRILCGIFAVPMTLLSTIFITGGAADALEGRPAHLFLAVPILGCTLALWYAAGMTFRR